MNFYRFLVLIALLALANIPVVRRNPAMLIPLRCLTVPAVFYYGANLYGSPGIPLGIYFALVLAWLTIEEVAWVSYLKVREQALPSLASEPDKRVRPTILASIASGLGAMVAFPLFSWLWLGGMADKMRAAGLDDAAASATSMMKTQILSAIIVPAILIAVLVISWRKSPYVLAHRAFMKAMWSSGDTRRDLFERVVRFEQDMQASAARESDVEQRFQPDIRGQ